MSIKETWLSDTLCSLGDDVVRVERGPQMLRLQCNAANLDDSVTAPHYRIGGRDASGKFIKPGDMPEDTQAQREAKAMVHAAMAREAKAGVYGVVNDGDDMHVLDWKEKHTKHTWKVYELQEMDDLVFEKPGVPLLDDAGKPVKQKRFIKVNELATPEEAMAFARTLVEG